MGDFRFEVNAVGGHGCSRDVQDGEQVPGCTEPSCVDCMFARFLEELRGKGTSVKDAVIVHWPNSTQAVLDVFTPRTEPGGMAMLRTRRGTFNKKT